MFIEANVKKWGLAPMTGSLAPPPPYGSEQGSILLEAGREGAASSHSMFPPDVRHGRTRSGNIRSHPPTSPGPIRSPTDISLAHLAHISSHEDVGEGPSSTIQRTSSNVGLGVTEHDRPPPEYTSPLPSEAGSRRNSEDSERTPMIRRKSTPPPIPSYSDVLAGDRRRERRDSSSSR